MCWIFMVYVAVDLVAIFVVDHVVVDVLVDMVDLVEDFVVGVLVDYVVVDFVGLVIASCCGWWKMDVAGV